MGLTVDEIKKIVSLYRKSETITDVSAKTGLSRHQVKKALVTAGVFSSKMSCQVQKLAESGDNGRQIQDILHVSHATVNDCLPYHFLKKNQEQLPPTKVSGS